MNSKEVAVLLTAIAAIDDRIDPDEPRIAMWCATLREDMPLDFARMVVIKHYAEHKNILMPADFNLAWKQQRIKQREEEAQRELEALSSGGVPMPDYVRAIFEETGVRKS